MGDEEQSVIPPYSALKTRYPVADPLAFQVKTTLAPPDGITSPKPVSWLGGDGAVPDMPIATTDARTSSILVTSL